MSISKINRSVKFGQGAIVLLFQVVIFSSSFFLVSCEKQRQEEAKTVRLYTSVPVKIIHEIQKKFEKKHKSIKLEVSRAGTSTMMKRIRNEASAGEVAADVIWLADFSNAEELKRSGLLQKYQSPETQNIFPLFKDKEGYYTGSRLLNMVLAYNTNYVKQEPTSYKDLLDPKWQGRVGIVSPETSGSSFYTLSSLMLEPQYGQQFIAQLSKNGVQVINNNSTMTEKIAGGELYMGITIDFTVRNLKNKYPDLPVSYVYPADGTVVIASPIALAKDSKEPEKSKVFIDWVLSTKGQSLMSQQLGIAPVREDVTPPVGMIPLVKLLVFPSDPVLIDKNRDITLNKYHDLFHKN
ncbi:MAG: ABC transporter substrate-binding protein [Gammaproteobacteria bacterium]|nr:ABC transporter substrate-binding protein [Gammaproteobacteria bacterium]